MNDNGEVVDDNDDDDKGETEEEDIDLHEDIQMCLLCVMELRTNG